MKSTNTKTTTQNLLTQLTLAGTAALAASAADGQIIVTNVNENIGFAPGDLASFSLSIPGLSGLSIFAHYSRFLYYSPFVHRATFSDRNRSIRMKGNPGFASFKKPRNFTTVSSYYGYVVRHSPIGIVHAPAGKKWATISGSSRAGSTNSGRLVNGTFGAGYFFARFGNGLGFAYTRSGVWEDDFGTPLFTVFTDQYVPFKFLNTLTGLENYGWIEASEPGVSYNSLNLHIDSYAYDASGAQIAMGQTSSVPEPSPALAFAALSALSLGAVGVRRLKAMQAA